jgi:hypothetical protein
MKYALSLAIALATFLLPAAPARAAGPFNDALSTCLVRSTSEQDRTLLVRWFFAAMAQHPNVKDLGHVTPAQAEQLNKDVAGLFWALISDRCAKETREAVKYEGADTLGASFEVLGKVAAQGLMSDATVNAYMGGLSQYLDEKKMKALFEADAPAKP